MSILDPVANFVELTVSQGYTSAATQVTILSADTHWDLLPDPVADGNYDLLWYDDTNYQYRPHDDPNREWVRVTAKNDGTYTLTITRAQQSTAATDKNTSGATYKMLLAISAKHFNDIENATVDVGSKYAWITEYDATGDGVADDKTAFSDAVTAGITHIVIPEGTWRFGSSYSIPYTVTLEFLRNAVLAPDGGVTVTINGAIIAGNWQIFGGAGTVDIEATNRIPSTWHRWDGGVQDKQVFKALGGNDAFEVEATNTEGIKITNQTSSYAMELNGEGIMFDTMADAAGSPAAGNLYLADRSTWDPASLGIGGRYFSFYDGSAYVPLMGFKVVESGSIDVSSTGIKTCTIAHGLSYTPAATQVMLCAYQATGSNHAMLRQLTIDSTDATNLNVYCYVDAAAATTTAKVVAWIRI